MYKYKRIPCILLSVSALFLTACGGSGSTDTATLHPAFDRALVSRSPNYSPSGDIIETSPTFSWKVTQNATEYEFGHENPEGQGDDWHSYEISATQAGCQLPTNQFCSYKPTDISFSVGDEKAWWVRAKVAGDWKDWSQAHLFKVIQDPNTGGKTPEIITPKGDITETHPEFSWTSISLATEYQFGYENLYTPDGWEDYTVTPAQANCTISGSDCTYTPSTNFAIGDQKIWWVRSKVSGQWSDWSEGSEFSVVNNGTGTERPFVIKVKGYRTQTGSSQSVQVRHFYMNANPAYNYNYNVDCNNDGILEASGVTGSYTCEYPDLNEYTISISGQFPALVSNGRMIREVKQWGTQQWRSMENAFKSARLDITATDIPDLTKVSSMRGMFDNAYSLSVSNISEWDVSNVTNMSRLFLHTRYFNEDISNWDVSNVTDMSSMFTGNEIFNQDISNWDTSNVTDMSYMFGGCNKFNQDISTWNVSKVTNMKGMFSAARNFTHDIGNWDVSNVTDMSTMFASGNQYNEDISGWEVSKVTNMQGMFAYNRAFNQDISSWNVGRVEDMGSMFLDAQEFNHDIGGWDVGRVTSMSFMFGSAYKFNQSINNWDVSNVTNMESMFSYTKEFNQPIDNWDVSNVTNMGAMFRNTDSFNQNISNWDVSKVKSMRRMFYAGKLSTNNYDSLLNGWSALPLQSSVKFGAGDTKYSSAAVTARNKLISDFSWTINDGGLQ